MGYGQGKLNSPTTVRDSLNRMSPAAADAKLGDVLVDLVANFNALLVKLDGNHAAATDHAATLKVADIESR